VSFKLPVSSVEKLYRGDTIKIWMTLTDGDTVQDLDELDEIYFTAKINISDADDAATTIQKTLADGITIQDAPTGLILITLQPEDTANNAETQKYFCDVQGKQGTEIHTFDDGEMLITVDITRAD
jgi:hypothetical protein